jgi:chemotaxis signal transduction protein
MALDVVFFEVRGRRCALPVSAVSEVLAMPAVTPVPHAPPAVRGIAPLRGQVLPVIDLGFWLAPSTDEWGEGTFFAPGGYRSGAEKVLLVEAALGEGTPARAALAVDRVMRLGTIDETHGRPPPPGPSFVTGTVLDVEGPALLIDAARAVEKVREAVRATVTS